MVIKSRSSYYIVDTANKRYSFLSAPDSSIDYGEFPARIGESDTFVTFAAIKDANTGYPASVRVRSFEL
jgi:hypothetical protein